MESNDIFTIGLNTAASKCRRKKVTVVQQPRTHTPRFLSVSLSYGFDIVAVTCGYAHLSKHTHSNVDRGRIETVL